MNLVHFAPGLQTNWWVGPCSAGLMKGVVVFVLALGMTKLSHGLMDNKDLLLQAP